MGAPLGMVQEGPIIRKLFASLDNFDAEYMFRLVRMHSDVRIYDLYYIESGSRSTIRQAFLRKGYELGWSGFNPANRPGTSEHEYGYPGHPGATAVDIHPIPGRGGSFAKLHAVAAEYGFEFKIKGELWHMTMRRNRAPLAVPTPVAASNAVVDEGEDDMADHPISFWRWPNGDEVQLYRDGSVYCYGEFKGYGGMGDIKPEFKRTFREAGSVRPIDRNNASAGYVVWERDGKSFWTFDYAVSKYF